MRCTLEHFFPQERRKTDLEGGSQVTIFLEEIANSDSWGGVCDNGNHFGEF